MKNGNEKKCRRVYGVRSALKAQNRSINKVTEEGEEKRGKPGRFYRDEVDESMKHIGLEEGR